MSSRYPSFERTSRKSVPALEEILSIDEPREACSNYGEAVQSKGAFGPLFYKGISEDSKVVFRRRLEARFAHLDRHLADNEYLLGQDFTVADAHFFTVTNWAPRVHFDLSPYPNVLVHLKRIDARPTVKAAMEAEGPIPG